MEKYTGVSIVVPFLNEEESIQKFCVSIDAFAAEQSFHTEVVFVNDGSTDNTVEQITKYAFQNVDKVKIINLTKNFGSQLAIRAGIQNATYDICTWVSVDLQEPIEFIVTGFEKLNTGDLDIIYIEKADIDVGFVSQFFSKQYNALMRKYAIKNYPSSGLGALIFNKKVKDFLNQNIEINSEIVLQLLDAGFRHEIIRMSFSARTAGKSKWTFAKKIKLFIDSFVSFSYMPIRMVSVIGISFSLIGLILALVSICNKILNPGVPVGYSTIVSVLALGFGVTNISLGIIAEYLWRTFDVSRRQAPFIISNEMVIKDCEEA